MSVLSTLMAVIKFAPILGDLSSVAAIEDTCSMLMEELALVGLHCTHCSESHNIAHSTVDTSDCVLNNGGCDQVCTSLTNVSGPVQCGCNTGYSLNVDGRTCSGRITTICVI